MATNTFTRYTAKNVGTTPVVLVTAASATQTTVIGLTAANTTTAPITVDAYVTASAVNYYVVKGATVPVGSSLALFGADGKIVEGLEIGVKAVHNFAQSAFRHDFADVGRAFLQIIAHLLHLVNHHFKFGIVQQALRGFKSSGHFVGDFIELHPGYFFEGGIYKIKNVFELRRY